jgi:hypothetical protein
MFRRNNMSLRILKMHLNKVGAVFLKETIRPLLQRFQQVPSLLALLVQKYLTGWARRF